MEKRIFRFCCIASLFLITVSFAGQIQAKLTDVRLPAKDQQGTLKVMTFNIRVDVPFIGGFNSWASRKDIVSQTISKENADVIALQEALDYQVEYIQLALPQYANYSVGRNDGQKKGDAQ